MTVKELRQLTGLSQTAFGNKYHIPMRTIQNWETGVNQCPVYQEELLEFKVRYDLEKGIESGMNYIIIESRGNDEFTKEFKTELEALTQAEIDWKTMCDNDKKTCKEFYVLESANPDEDAESHYDGNIIKRWK